MGQSLAGASVLLALIACVSICCHVLGDNGKWQSDEITFEREQIFVNFENGTTFSVMVEPNETVEDLWDHMIDYEAVPDHLLYLKLGDTQLDDKAKLSDYNIQANSTVTLVRRPDFDNTTTFKVRTPDGRHLEVTTQLDITVASLKEIIRQLSGIPEEEQRLVKWGKQLKDDRKLYNFWFRLGTTVHLGTPLEDCRREVTFRVMTLSGAKISVTTNFADTVDGLKEKISKITGVPTGVQRIFDKRGQLITGEDHLCDLELLPGPIVHMYFHSSRITSLEQVARIRVDQPGAHSIDPEKGPIFREVDLVTHEQTASWAASLLKDARNWVPRKGRRPIWSGIIFDPNAYMSPSPEHNDIKRAQKTLESMMTSKNRQKYGLEAVILGARVKLSLALEPFWHAAHLSVLGHSQKFRAITLGGGYPDLSPGQVVSLGADVNNWAPDGFSDSDLTSLFELTERVRQVLARSEKTGEPILSIAHQRRINQEILFSYIVALTGYPPSVQYNQEINGEECAICRDELTVELAVKLPCGHAFHEDCIASLVADLYQKVSWKLKAFVSVTTYFYETQLESTNPLTTNHHRPPKEYQYSPGALYVLPLLQETIHVSV